MSRTIVALCGSIAIGAFVGTVAEAKTTASTKQTEKTQKEEIHSSWPAEYLPGKIAMVDPQKRLLVVKDSSGVPFDFIVGRSTRIESGGRSMKLPELASLQNDSVSIKYVPERKGDVAESIELGQP